MKKLHIIFTFISVFYASAYSSDSLKYITKHYNTEDGLSNNIISDIYKDENGFMWFATWDGLNRFDGYNFKTYKAYPGDNSPLAHNRIAYVEEGKYGNLWAYTFERNVYRYNIKKEIFEDILNYKSTGYTVLYDLTSKTSDVWLFVKDVGLFCVLTNKETNETKIYKYSSYRNVSFIHEEDDHTIWIGNNDSIICLQKQKNGQYHSVKIPAYPQDNYTSTCSNKQYRCFVSQTRLLVLDKENERFSVYPYPTQINQTNVEILYNDIYIGSNTKGLLHFNLKKKIFSFPDGCPVKFCKLLLADEHGIVWLRTELDGILIYDSNKKYFKSFEIQVRNPKHQSLGTNIFESNGRVWISMKNGGFGWYDRKTNTLKPFNTHFSNNNKQSTNEIAVFYIDDSDVLWHSTYKSGFEKVILVQEKMHQILPQANATNVSTNEVRSIFEDRDENLWVGTQSGMLFCYDKNLNLRNKLKLKSKLGGFCKVYHIVQDNNGILWVGTRLDGLFRIEYNTFTNDFESIDQIVHSDNDKYSISSNDIFTLFFDNNNRLWIGTWNGGINQLVQTKSGFQFKNRNNVFSNYPEECKKIRCINQDKDGLIWVGTTRGLVIFNPELDSSKIKFSLFRKIPGDISSVGNNNISNILKDNEGFMWLATMGGGVNKCIQKENNIPKFISFTTNDGLISDYIIGMVEEKDGNIWFTAENGLCRINKMKGTFKAYTKFDGFESSIFSESSCCSSKNGNIYFGSQYGFYFINPSQLKEEYPDFKLSFTDLRVQNKIVNANESSILKEALHVSQEFILPYDYSVFSIEYATLNYPMQSKVHYSYILEGFEEKWNNATLSRMATYTNIPHGKYIFKVRAFLTDSPERFEEKSIIVKITPPFWKSIWAYITYIILIIIIMYIAVRILNIMIALKNKVRIEQQLSELKLKFFTNFSHELRIPLTLIEAPIDSVLTKKKISIDVRDNLSLAMKNIRRMSQMINEILAFRKVMKGKVTLSVRSIDLIQLINNEIIPAFKSYAYKKNISLTLNSVFKTLEVWIDEDKIQHVIYNLLSNAFKFTPNGGSIKIEVLTEDENKNVMINVSDTGIGIPPEKLQLIFERFEQFEISSGTRGSGVGLSLCKDYVELHKGKLWAENNPNGGAKFIISLPIGNSHFKEDEIKSTELNKGKKDVDTLQFQYEDIAQISRRTDYSPNNENPIILLVEDNTELRIFMFNQLIDNYQVIEAEDGGIGLQMVKEHKPDLIISDVMMPNMDGLEMTDKLRNDIETSHIPIILLTAKSSIESRLQGIKYGADYYITKPFNMKLLSAQIKNLIARRQELITHYLKSEKRISLAPSEIIITDHDKLFIENILQFMEENYADSELKVDDLSDLSNLSRTSFYMKFKSISGKSPIQFINDFRLEKAENLIRSSHYSISEISYMVGFDNPGYFNRRFKEKYGTSPGKYV